jgi:hypothetical protein
MKFFLKLFYLIPALLLAACSAPGTATLQPTQSQTSTSVPSTASQSTTAQTSSFLTIDFLKNAEFHAPTYDKSIVLTNGKYESKSGADYLLVELLPQTALGDLNGDNRQDAAVLLAENGGGSGVFVSLIAITDQNGKPFQAGATLIDDRPQINTLSIQNGKIILDAIIHASGDAMARPSFPVIETYQLFPTGLTQTRVTSRTPDGQEKSIRIESPSSGSQANGSVRLKGSMPIAPNENKLVYRIEDTLGNKVDEGPFQVNADTPGGKATFDKTIIIPPLPAGTVIHLELKEVDVKDGSTLAMDSIVLDVK